MRKYFFVAIATLIMATVAVVSFKAYQYFSIPSLLRANLEALSNPENDDFTEKHASRWLYYKFGSKPVTYPSGDLEGYLHIQCCVYTGNIMDGCRFSNEDQWCESARQEK